jgi:hypothetical protein
MGSEEGCLAVRKYNIAIMVRHRVYNGKLLNFSCGLKLLSGMVIRSNVVTCGAFDLRKVISTNQGICTFILCETL